MPPIIEVNNLYFSYNQRIDEETLTNVSFTVERGEWLAVVGHNGSGKSTLAQILVGLLSPQKGQIKIAGQVLNEESKWEIRQTMGIVFQNPDNQFIGTTVQDDVAFGLENLNMSYMDMETRIDEALRMVEMSSFRFSDPSRLSGGQKQRVAIAGILALTPSVMILDEALVMLDPPSRRKLLNILHLLKEKEGLTIISITHDMNEAASADRVLMMESGQVVRTGSPKSVFGDVLELEPPFAEALRRTLLKKGRNVPQRYMTESEMEKWLCK